MELALAVLRLWEHRVWLAIGVAVAVAVGIAALSTFKTTVYSSASTQMVVDAPKSALGNTQASLIPFTNRAVVFARLMVSPQALTYIGQQAGIPGNEIDAQGPAEIGAPQATHQPTAVDGGKLESPPDKFVLRLDQNPELPTVDVYSQAPTTSKAIALANGAVTGFAKYLVALDNQTGVAAKHRITIRQLGAAQGGVVNSGTSRALAALLGLIVFTLWCVGILFLTRLRDNLRAPRPGGSLAEPVPVPVPVLDVLDPRPTGLLLPEGAREPRRANGNGNGNGNGNSNGTEAPLTNGHRRMYTGLEQR
jgi:hypothetical protein